MEIKEKEDLLWQQKQNKVMLSQYQQNNRSLEGKIEALEAVKKNLEERKDNCGDLAKRALKFPSELKGNWRGNLYEETKEMIKIGNKEKCKTLVNNIDFLLDSVCDEITRLKNEKSSNIILISDIQKGLNELSNQLETYFN